MTSIRIFQHSYLFYPVFLSLYLSNFRTSLINQMLIYLKATHQIKTTLSSFETHECVFGIFFRNFVFENN